MKVEISCKFSQRKDIFLASVIKSLKQLLYAGYTQKRSYHGDFPFMFNACLLKPPNFNNYSTLWTK